MDLSGRAGDTRPTVVFVGAFGGGSGRGVYGGQIAACRGILESRAARGIRWLTVDSTMTSIPPPPLWRRAGSAFRRMVRVWGLLGRERVDGMLVFTADGWSFLEKGWLAVLGRMAGVQVVLAPRSGMLIDDLESGPVWRRALWRLLFRAPHLIVCQSESWADFFSKQLGRDPEELPVIRNGVVLPEKAEKHRAMPADGNLRLLYLGWLESFKGPQVLAGAFLRLWQRHPGLHLHICGSGSAEGVLRELLVEPLACGRVSMSGWVEGRTKEAAWTGAGCFVLPSLREGSPNALLEAMAHGVPVIATAVGAVPEILSGGRFGLLVPPGDAGALAEAIEKFLLEPEEAGQRALRALEHLREHHDAERIAGQWTGLFRRERAPAQAG